MIKRMEDRVIKIYGFENWRTILIFRVTNILRKFSKKY